MNTKVVSSDIQKEFAEPDQVLKDLKRLALNEKFCDVTFVIDLEEIPAHRAILAARNNYFRMMLFGGFSESIQPEVTLEAPSEAFKKIVNYLYTGEMVASQLNNEYLVDVLDLANQYDMPHLISVVSADFLTRICLENIFWIFNTVMLYNLKELVPPCLKFIDQNASKIIGSNEFNDLREECVPLMFERDSFHAKEIDIFLAIMGWCSFHPTVQPDTLISHVRWSVIGNDDLRKIVRPSGLVKPELISKTIVAKKTIKRLPHRGTLLLDCDVIPKAKVLCLYSENNKVDTKAKKYLAKYTITPGNLRGVEIALNDMYLLNYIKFQLWHQDKRVYSYSVDFSPDHNVWDTVIDYHGYKCRSWQYLHFAPRPVRYIRFLATTNATDRQFYVCKMVALYTTHPSRQIQEIVEPIVNVATVKMGATIVEGVSFGQNAMINEDYGSYANNHNYTHHSMRLGCILIRLAQPYYIDSLRLLLLDLEGREYGFYIETSENFRTWHMAVDKSNELLRSWQDFTFTPRIVLFIRIKGTLNRGNESQTFGVVHLECPSQHPTRLKALQMKNPEAFVTHDIPDKLSKLKCIKIRE